MSARLSTVVVVVVALWGSLGLVWLGSPLGSVLAVTLAAFGVGYVVGAEVNTR